MILKLKLERTDTVQCQYGMYCMYRYRVPADPPVSLCVSEKLPSWAGWSGLAAQQRL